MKLLTELTPSEAKAYFLKGSSYFNHDFPLYISFEPILQDVAKVLNGKQYFEFKLSNPALLPDVNYNFIANKDGRFAWRPIELMHPAIYVSLVNLMCGDDNWEELTKRFAEFANDCVTCCSPLVISEDEQSDKAAQVRNWWQAVEQQSLKYSLEFSHVLHTDVSDCYASLYTHSIAWALHGLDIAKAQKGDKALLGNCIDSHMQASRYGQTNGISQGSVLMDFIAELVLGYVDTLVAADIGDKKDFRILRYRDDYRIFANSDVCAEEILKIISDKLRMVGMHLGVAKTNLSTNVVEGSIKSDKLAGIDLQSLGSSNAKTIQKQLLRLHSFGRRFPNSGALRRLVGELHGKVLKLKVVPDDLEVQIAIATDIAVVSPSTFPAVAGLLSQLLSLAPSESKGELWARIVLKMSKVPYNGYLQIWLQRVAKPKLGGLEFNSNDPICRVVDGEDISLWNNEWISSADLKASLLVSKILVKEATETSPIVALDEVELFTQYAWAY
jgi:hypothetical protein